MERLTRIYPSTRAGWAALVNPHATTETTYTTGMRVRTEIARVASEANVGIMNLEQA